MKEVNMNIGELAKAVADSAVSKNNEAQPAQSFDAFLKDSLREVNELQHASDKAVQELAAGKTENIHETMIAMQKAKVSFQMMMQVRNKIIEAYKEIMQSSM